MAIFYKSECQERECHICDAEYCGEMDRLMPRIIVAMGDPKTYDLAQKALREEFPNIDWNKKRNWRDVKKED